MMSLLYLKRAASGRNNDSASWLDDDSEPDEPFPPPSGSGFSLSCLDSGRFGRSIVVPWGRTLSGDMPVVIRGRDWTQDPTNGGRWVRTQPQTQPQTHAIPGTQDTRDQEIPSPRRSESQALSLRDSSAQWMQNQVTGRWEQYHVTYDWVQDPTTRRWIGHSISSGPVSSGIFGIHRMGTTEGAAVERDDTTEQLTQFLANLGHHLPEHSEARRDTEFWKNQDFALFRKWVNLSGQIGLLPGKEEDFKRSMTSILELFYTSAPYREFASTVSDPAGCGDLKAIAYIQLRTAVPLFNGELTRDNVDQIEALSKALYAIEAAVKDIDQRVMDGDHSDQILSVLLYPPFQEEFGGHSQELRMLYAFAGLPVPLKESVSANVRQEIAVDKHLVRMMATLPVFSPLRATVLSLFDKYNEKAGAAAHKPSQKKENKRDEFLLAESLLAIKNHYDAKLARKLRQLLQEFVENKEVGRSVFARLFSKK